MFDRQELYRRGCVQTLIDVIEQAPTRWSARGAPVLDENGAGLLLLWTLLRWERAFLIRCLERLGVDLWSLTCAVDDGLCQIQGLPADPSQKASGYRELCEYARRWLDRAQKLARSLGHNFLGTEHLFLALLAEDGEPLRGIFAAGGLNYKTVKNAILEAIARPVVAVPAADVVAAVSVAEEEIPWGARWDRQPAVGLPRRFGMAVLMLHVTLFAVIFSMIRVIDSETPLAYYLVTAVFVLGVALGQMFLFEGKHPRAASVWAGGVLLPLESAVAFLFAADLPTEQRIGGSICWLIGGIPLGGFFGYLSGGLTAGIVLLIDRWSAPKEPPEDPPENPMSQDDSQE
ncbi:MAG: Clp protease N-terminal domain-containing protein [Pirellulales bacterium]|nr:Clp protease N-terminal domain-containing protein [Pirellulales bacterium]